MLARRAAAQAKHAALVTALQEKVAAADAAVAEAKTAVAAAVAAAKEAEALAALALAEAEAEADELALALAEAEAAPSYGGGKEDNAAMLAEWRATLLGKLGVPSTASCRRTLRLHDEPRTRP